MFKLKWLQFNLKPLQTDLYSPFFTLNFVTKSNERNG